jgi:hypothetical protein
MILDHQLLRTILHLLNQSTFVKVTLLLNTIRDKDHIFVDMMHLLHFFFLIEITLN